MVRVLPLFIGIVLLALAYIIPTHTDYVSNRSFDPVWVAGIIGIFFLGFGLFTRKKPRMYTTR